MATAVGLLALMMLGWMAVIFGPIVRLIGGGAFNMVWSTAIQQAGESAVATAAVWIAMIALSVASYYVALWRFQKIEAIQERKAASCL
jgi:Na+/alanine symporter